MNCCINLLFARIHLLFSFYHWSVLKTLPSVTNDCETHVKLKIEILKETGITSVLVLTGKRMNFVL